MTYLVYEKNARWKIDVCVFNGDKGCWEFDIASDISPVRPSTTGRNWRGPYASYVVIGAYDTLNEVMVHRTAEDLYKQIDAQGLTRKDIGQVAGYYRQIYSKPMPQRPTPPAPAVSARVERAQKAVSPWLRESAKRAFERAALGGERPRNIIQHYPCRGPAYDYWGNKVK